MGAVRVTGGAIGIVRTIGGTTTGGGAIGRIMIGGGLKPPAASTELVDAVASATTNAPAEIILRFIFPAPFDSSVSR
jgi:hypothetical protein